MSKVLNLPAGRRLRTPEAAAYLGLSVSTLEKMRSLGGGPAFMAMGRAVTYAVADLDAWATARTVRNTSEARANMHRQLTRPLNEATPPEPASRSPAKALNALGGAA